MAKRSQMTGARSVDRTLTQIVPGLNAPINAASRKALRPTLRQAKANLRANGSVLSGDLLRLMTIKRDRKAPKNRPTHQVGPDASKGPAYREAHLVEFGTAPHMIKGWLHPGARAFPFLRPAFEATKDLIIKIYGDEIGPAVEKKAAQLARRAQK